jgi:hypothetical protein
VGENGIDLAILDSLFGQGINPLPDRRWRTTK